MNELTSISTRKSKGRPRLFLLATPIVGVAVMIAAASPAQADERDRREYREDRNRSQRVQVRHQHHQERRNYRHNRRSHHRDKYNHRGHDTKVRGSVVYRNDNFGIHVKVGDRDRYHHRHHYHRPRGHYETRVRKVLVRKGYAEKIYVPPVYETRCDRWGRSYEVLIREGYYKTIHHPPVYRHVRERVWVSHRGRC